MGANSSFLTWRDDQAVKHKTPIQWTHIPGFVGATWNPLAGCLVKSPGCKNCYAMGLAGRRLVHTPKYAGLTEMTKAGPVWSGKTNEAAESTWTQPLRWRKLKG